MAVSINNKNGTTTKVATNVKIVKQPANHFMTKAVYDPNGEVARAGGIKKYVEGKTGDVVTPQMYGAKADGVTDDTNAVSQALNSGSVVYIPKGKYLVSWGLININNSTKDIVIYGDGEDSILLFNPLHKHPDTSNAAHGFMIRNRENSSNRVNIYIHDIQIRYENSDTSITYPSDEARLFGCVGYFKNIILDHVYMHDSMTTSTTPKDSLMWLQVDADNVIVSNSKFENFTNNIVGGCVWINSGYFGVNYHINNISIINNILRNTNQDEAIAVWALPEGLIDIDNIMIDGNEIVHKNWNGECTASHSVIGIATLSGGSVTNKSYTISNNTITTEKISQGVIRNIGVDKLLVSDNTITILGVGANVSTVNLIENYKNAYSVIKDNHVEIVGVTKKLILFSQQGNIDYINNIFETSNNIQLASYGDDNYDVQKVLNFIGNTIVFRTPTTSLFEVNNHGIWLTMNIVDNKVNGGLRLIANSTQNTKVQDNIFNVNNEVSTVALEASKVLSFIGNKNIVLEINNTNISTKLTAFKYSGLKSGLVFKVGSSVVDDSAEVRARFFTVCDIVYEGVPPHGTTGQVLIKSSDADYDTEWGSIEGIEKKKVYTPVDVTIIDGAFISRSSGNVVSNTGTHYCELSVNPTERYRISGAHSDSLAIYAFYTANGTFISAYPTSNVNVQSAYDITIPDNAYILKCSGYKNYPLKVWKISENGYEIILPHDALYGKKWFACGDSFTAGDFSAYTDSEGHTGPYSDGYDPFDAQFRTYPYWIGKRTGILYDDKTCAAGGIDFVNVEGARKPFSNENSSRNYTMIPSDCDYITLQFGLNELDLTAEQIGTSADTTNETLWGAYNVVLTSILTNNPKVKIGIIISDAWMCANTAYYNALIDIAKYWGIPYLDLSGGDDKVPMMISRRGNVSTIAKTLRGDAMAVDYSANPHPNPEGHKYRSTVIENFLRSL